MNEPVLFQFNNILKPEKLTASLVRPVFIPQYVAAQKHFKNQTPINASVCRITAHSIYLNVIGDKLQAKMPAAEGLAHLKEADKIKIIITYLSAAKIAVKPA